MTAQQQSQPEFWSNPNDPYKRALLNTLRFAEGTWNAGDKGYGMLFGGRIVNNLDRHPDTVVRTPRYNSAAAGAYQFLPTTWEGIPTAVRGSDFGPAAQDRAALWLAHRRGVTSLGEDLTDEQLKKLGKEWAAVPGSEYGQPTADPNAFRKFYKDQLALLRKDQTNTSSPATALTDVSQTATPQAPVTPTIQYSEDGKSMEVTPPGSGNTTVRIKIEDGEKEDNDPVQSMVKNTIATIMKNSIGGGVDYMKLLNKKNPYSLDGDESTA